MLLHKLYLTISCLSLKMLLRNLNTKRGLCNGTQLIVRDLKPNWIIAEVLNVTCETKLYFFFK